MSNYAHLNLKDDVENMAERFGLAPDLETHFARKALGVEGGGFSYQRYAPGYRAPVAHRHRTHEEVYVVVGGGGRVKIDDDVHPIREWDALRFAPGTARAFEAGPDGLELIAIGFGEAGDAEMLEGFWGDEGSPG